MGSTFREDSQTVAFLEMVPYFIEHLRLINLGNHFIFKFLTEVISVMLDSRIFDDKSTVILDLHDY